jgi:hypothetical protein
MKYSVEIEFETEKHCLLCPIRDEETDDCKLQYCEEFTTWEEQMKNCPLKPIITKILQDGDIITITV